MAKPINYARVNIPEHDADVKLWLQNQSRLSTSLIIAIKYLIARFGTDDAVSGICNTLFNDSEEIATTLIGSQPKSDGVAKESKQETAKSKEVETQDNNLDALKGDDGYIDPAAILGGGTKGANN